MTNCTHIRRRCTVSLSAAVLLWLSLPAAAEPVSEVSLLAGWMTERGTRMAAVRIELAPGWKTYWRQPMGNGIPPQFDWSASQNVERVRVHWPAPMIFETYGSVSIGYATEVVLPVEITPQDPGAPVTLDLGLFYGVCEEVCIPAEAAVSLVVGASETGGATAIRAALVTVAKPGEDAGVQAHSCRILPAGGDFALTADIETGRRLASPEMVVFETGSEEVWINPERWAVADERVTVDATLAYYGTGSFAFDRSAVTITLIGGGEAIELRGCPAP